MSALTKEELVPLVNKIRDMTGLNYYLSYDHVEYYALHCDGVDVLGQGYVPLCDLFEQMVSFIAGFETAIRLKK